MASRLLPGIPDAGEKGYRHGTHRTVAPAVTLERLRRLMAPMGISRVANITGLDRVGVPVVVACRPNSRSLSVSQGKGIDLTAAKASGIMESVEQYHAERILRPLRLASYNELRHVYDAVPGESLPCLVVSRYHRNLRIPWIEGFDVLQQRPTLVPYELVHLNFTLPLPEGSGCFPMSSNGLASGNHLLEAVLHGACEVVERDAVALWELRNDGQRAATRVRLDTIDDPACRSVLRQFDLAGLSTAVWDVTSDVGVPAFRCTIVDRSDDGFRVSYPSTGSGCHVAREIALLRALTEAAQGRLTMIAGSRDDIPRSDYEITRRAEVLAQVRASLTAEPALWSFDEIATRTGESFEDDVVWLSDRLRAAGLPSLVVVDLSIRGLGVAVVRVVIPGLEQQRMGVDYLPGARARAWHARLSRTS